MVSRKVSTNLYYGTHAFLYGKYIEQLSLSRWRSNNWSTTIEVTVEGGMLKSFGMDLTELAQSGRLDPVIGREEEVRRTLQMYL